MNGFSKGVIKKLVCIAHVAVITASWAGSLLAGELQTVEVATAFIELHTGPGRGYPVFHVVERGQTIAIIKRKTDWFKIRTEQGKEGWVNRAQMETTLTEAGIKQTFRDVLFDDFLKHRIEFGFDWGQFEGDPLMKVHTALKLNDYFSTELAYTQVTGKFSSSTLLYLSLMAHPFTSWRASPFFSLGFGNYENKPKATLVNNQSIDASAANVAFGLRVYMTDRFLLRTDLREYAVFIDDNRTETFSEWTLGLSFFY